MQTRYFYSLYAEWVIEALLERGVTLDEIARTWGISVEQLQRQQQAMPFDRYLEILNWAAIRCEDPWLGLHIGAAMIPEKFGIFGYLIRHCASLRELCTMISKYIALLTPAVRMDFVASDEIGRLSYRIVAPAREDVRHDIEQSLAAVVTLFRSPLGENWYPMHTRFSFPAPDDVTELRRCFGDGLLFNQPCDAIEFDSAILDAPINDSDPSLLAVLLQQADRILAELALSPDLVDRTRVLIMSELHSGRLNSDAAARRLNLSRSALYRQLKNAGTSFQALKDEIVAQTAKQALAETDASISEIALRLGYSEHSGFVHSFTRLAGMSPSAYRQHARSLAG